MKRVLRVLICLPGVLLLPIACVEEEQTPPEKCEVLLDVICDRIQACGEEMGETAPLGFHQDCVDAQKTSINCGNAVDVTSSYPTCIDDVMGFSCNVFIGEDVTGEPEIRLPSACMGVILLDN